MSSEPLIYSELRLQQVGTLIFIQPLQGSKVIGPSLTVELGTGTVGLAEHSVPLKGTETIYGVIGLARFLGGSALAVITDAEQVTVCCLLQLYLLMCQLAAVSGCENRRYGIHRLLCHCLLWPHRWLLCEVSRLGK